MLGASLLGLWHIDRLLGCRYGQELWPWVVIFCGGTAKLRYGVRIEA